jgi:hypothetical protein
MERVDWREIARETVLSASFWAKEAVFVIAGIVFLHNLDNPQLIRVPFLMLGLG